MNVSSTTPDTGTPPMPRRRARKWAMLAAVAMCTALALGLATPINVGAADDDSAVLNEWNLIAPEPDDSAPTDRARPDPRHRDGSRRALRRVNAIDRGYEPYLLDVEALDVDAGASSRAASRDGT
jgi:hypothetical protein